MSEVYVETPRTKPVKAFKARVKVYDNDVVVVNPQEPRESNRKMIKQKGKLLYDDKTLQVYLNKTQKTVIIKTTLGCGPTIERELLGLQGSMARIIAQYYSDIIKVFNSKESRSQGVKESKTLTDEEIIDRV